MNWLDYMKGLIAGKKGAPEGYCPNCWGEQQYEGKFRDVLEKEHIDLNNVEENLGWIEAYVIENFEGIKVRDEDGRKICPACHREHLRKPLDGMITDSACGGLNDKA